MKRIFTLTLTLLLCGAWLANAQTRSVSGTVVSADDGVPVIGATVVVEGTQIGVTTNVKGEFTIANVPTTASKISVSFAGMETMSMDIQSRMSFRMRSETLMVQEVVVTTGMTKMDKRIFTGATDQLAGDKILMDGVADVSRSLEGRSAGVSVQNVSGTFGAAPKIRVRGATSIFGSSKPLWVLDGVILEDIVNVSADQLSSGDAVTLISSAVAGLNPDDVESFQILKDGSATSIYGARAMAGVIVITTKKGRQGTSTFNYTGEFSIRLVPSYSTFNIMNSQEQMDVYQDMYNKGFLQFSDAYRALNSGVYGRMYQMTNLYDPATGLFDMTSAEAQAYLNAASNRNTDWFKELFSPSLMQTHAISMSSGTDRSRSYTSMSFMNDPGWSEGSSVQRYTLNTNSTYDLFRNFSITLLGNASYRKQNAPGTTNQSLDTVNGAVTRDFDINPYSFALNSSRTLDADTYYTRNYAPFNIHNELRNNLMEIDLLDTKFQMEANWKVIPGLDLNVLGAVKYSVSNQTHKITESSNQAMLYRAGIDSSYIRDNNKWWYTDPDVVNSEPQIVLPKGGLLDKKKYKMLGYDFRVTANYNKVFCHRHYVSAFGGMELGSAERNYAYDRGWGYQYSKGGVPFYSYLAFKQGIEQGTSYYAYEDTYTRNAAFFGTATYSWDQKYSLTGTLRYEGNNALGEATSSRWLPTWNISGAWNAHEEEFFQALKPAFSHAKLRASYSLTADRGPLNVSNASVIMRNYTPWRPSAGDQESGIYIESLANTELTYEKKHEWNIGIDLGFLDNRINLVADVYGRDNYDLIGWTQTPGLGGEVYKMANVADMSSKGVEFTLSTRNIQKPNFGWSTDLTFSWAKNEITNLENRGTAINLVSGSGYSIQGYPRGSLFSYQFQGLNGDGIPTFINESGDVTSTNLNFQNRDNLADYLKYEGPSEPTVTGGLNNSFNYKNFRLNVFITYSFGNKVRLDPFFSSWYSDLSAMPREFRNRWAMPGDENITNIPTIASTRQEANIANLAKSYNAYNYSTERIADGGFVRFKEVSLSYDFGKRILDKLQMRSLQLKFQGTNLFLLYADKKLNGQDPEFFSSGGVAIPMPKQFTLSVRVGF